MEAPPLPPPSDPDVYLRAAAAMILHLPVGSPAVATVARFARGAIEVWKGLQDEGPWAGILQARIPRDGAHPRWRRFKEE